jgi:hypothetical protein
MSLCRLSFSFLLVVFIAYSAACAGTKGYMCTVATELHLNDDGSLTPYPRPLALGKRFAVDRSTGNLIESAPSLWSIPGEKVSVLSHGNRSNSFKATYTSPAAEQGVFHSLLMVEEYTDGVSKPFLLSSEGSVYAGVCE